MNVASIVSGATLRGCVMPAIPDDDAWAATEFLAAEWGDARRTQRLVELATVFAHRPGASLPEACGNRAMLKAAYRFFDHEAVAPQAIWEPCCRHQRPAGDHPTGAGVQDTTEVDWTAHPATTGLGRSRLPRIKGCTSIRRWR